MTREQLIRRIFILYGLALIVALVSFFPGLRWVHSRKAFSSHRGSLAEVHIYGTIHTAMGGASFGTPDADDIAQQLHKLSKDDNVKGILLRINSPGGTVGAVQSIQTEIERCRASGKVIVASLGDVAASGGYYLASSADRIVSEPGTIVGSIGVILEFGNIEGLMQKLGVRWEVIKSGAHKDIGSPTRALTAEEKQMLQGSIDNAYQQFVNAVTAGRHLPKEKILALADGRIFTGEQAKEAGLVDDLGNQQDAEETLIRLAHLPPEPTIISDTPHGMGQFLKQFSSQYAASGWGAVRDAWQGPLLEYMWR